MAHPKSHYHLTSTISDTYDDCYYYTVECWDGGIRQKVAGSGGTGVGGAIIDAGSTETTSGHHGVLSVQVTGTHTTARAGLGHDTLDTLILGSSYLNATIRFGVVARFASASQADGYWHFGLTDSISTGVPYGVYFYKADLTTVYGVCKNSTDSPALTVLTQDANWHTYEFEINAAASSVSFYVDGTLAGTQTSGIPTGVPLGYVPINYIRATGTASTYTYIDAYWYLVDFSSGRTA